MQFPDDTVLAAALEAGQERHFKAVFVVDWARDGNYADPNADLSSCIKSFDIDRQLTGNYPSELEITEGYAAAQVYVTLTGTAPDGTPVHRLFSPYSGLHPGSVAAIDSPCYLDIVVHTADGPRTIRQFTGYVRNATPSRRTGEVSLILRDAAARLAVPVDLPTWAADGLLRRQFLSPDEYPDVGAVALSWVVDDILRRAGWLQGPPWHPDVVVAWTVNGSALPGVGHFATIDPWITGTYTFGYYPYLLPNVTPAGIPADIWEPSPFGNAYKGYYIPDWGDRQETEVIGSAKCVSRFNPLGYGGNNSNLLGFSWQVKVDPTMTSGLLPDSEILIHLEEIRYDFGSINRYPMYAHVLLDHGTGVVKLELLGEGWTKTWRWRATINPTPMRWVNVYAVLHFTPGAITPHIFADGVELGLTVEATAAWPPPAITYVWPASSTNHGRVVANGPIQYAQVWFQANTSYANLVPPSFIPPNQTAQVDISTLKLTSIPKTRQRPAWDLLRELAQADLGALYVTEAGVPTFDSRATVAARRDTGNVARTLSLDDIADADPSAVLESVINVFTWDLNRHVAEIAEEDGALSPTPVPAVFRASTVQQFEVGPGANRTVPVTIGDDIMQVRVSNVTYRPQAMGYLEDGSPSISWESTMDFYSPAWWGNGFTPYRPGSRADPSQQPVPNVGVNAIVSLGFVDYVDTDPAHIRIALSNGSVNTAWYAVDDSTPFLHVAGVRVVEQPSEPMSALDAGSVAKFGYRVAPLAGGQWVQDEVTVSALVASLLEETAEPSPYFESLELLGDPRLQLQDVVRLDDPLGLGGPIFASVVGIRRSASERGLRDVLTLRTFGDSGLWIMGDPRYSIMGQTTIVS